MDSSAPKDSTPEFAFDVPPEQIVQSSRGKCWPGVDIAEIVHPLDDFALPPIPQHVLVIHLSGPIEITERRAGRHGHLETGGLVILPAGAPSTWHLDRRGEVRHLHLYLAPSLLQRIATEADLNPDTLELLETLGTRDPQVEAIARSLLCELRTGGLGGKLYAESLAMLLAIHLLRHHSSARLPAVARRPGLSPSTVQQVTAYIEEHLADNLSLAEIAAVASLSPYHFARCFKEALGYTPHQYVIQQRVERARLLLATTNWPIAAIAQIVGFASESHLALHFKRLTGLTPKHAR